MAIGQVTPRPIQIIWNEGNVNTKYRLAVYATLRDRINGWKIEMSLLTNGQYHLIPDKLVIGVNCML